MAGHAIRHVRPLKTFSVRFGGGAYYDESEHARAVARHIGATHLEEEPCSRELVGLLPSLIYHMDFGLPVWGAFGYIAVSRLAKRHVKVSLTGHGGDELFAGYPKHFGAAFAPTKAFEYSAPTPARGPSPISRLRRVFHREGIAGVVRRLGRRARWSPSFEDRWVASHCGEEPAHHPMLHPRFVQTLAGYSPRESYLRPLREAKTDEMLDQALYHDLRVYLQDLLAMEDRLSMAVSLESRIPLLDHRIVELVARVPPALKVPDLQPKWLLRDIARPLLPSSILDRDKSPFPIPVEKWFGDQLFSAAQAVLKSPRCLDRGVFHPDRLRTETLTPGLAWSLINVELWYRIFVDRDPQWIEQTRSLTTAPIDRSR